MKRIVGGLIVGLLLVAGASAPAQAAEGEGIDSYRIDYEIAADGVVHVTEDFRYTFEGSDHHGPERLVNTQEPGGNESGDYRIYRIDNASATSSTGAAATTNVEEIGNNTRIRIGDPNQTVSGTQQYTLQYDLRGALNKVDGNGELFWDAAGPDWTVPISDLTVTVSSPDGITKQRCLFGQPGSEDPCTGSDLSGGKATFTQDSVDPGEVLTVVAAFSPASVTIPAPEIRDRVTTADYFEVTPTTAGASAGVLGIGVLVLVLVLRRRRDLRYAGVTPGLSPPSGTTAAKEFAPAENLDQIAVQFAPPTGITPGEAGLLLRRRTSANDTTATLIDLAVRGYLHIDGSSGDWTLTARRPPDNSLRPHEQALLRGMFTDSQRIGLRSSARMLYRTIRQVNSALATTMKERKWFRRIPTGRFPIVLGCFLAWFCFVASFVFLIGIVAFVIQQRLGLVVVAAVVTIVLVLAALVLRRRKGRLPEGYAAYYQVAGFKRYLQTAEAEQLRFEEGENIFSRYLPWAIVFELTTRWAQTCEQLAREGRIPPDVDWYTGSAAWSYAGFSASATSFSSAVSSAGPSQWSSSSSGGGSGFSSSSSSGGGGGGGGGGSW